MKEEKIIKVKEREREYKIGNMWNIIVCALTSDRKIDGQFYGNTVFLPCNL